MKITTARTVPVAVMVAILAVLLFGTDLVRARQGTTPTEHRAVLNSDLGWVNLRQCTKATCVVLDQPDNGTVVIVRCWTGGQVADPDNHPGLNRWYLVTKIDGRYVGSSGYVYAALVKTPPQELPGCSQREGMTEIGTRYPLIPEAGQTVTLARGPAAQQGYWYSVTVRGLRPHTAVEVRCFDSEDDTPTDFLPDNVGFRRYPIRTDANGDAHSESGCYSAVNGKHTVSVDDWYSNSVLWGASPGDEPAATGAAPEQLAAAPRTPGTGRTDSPMVRLARGAAAPKGYRYAVTLRGFPASSTISVTCYDSVSPSGFYRFSLRTDSDGGASTTNQCYSGDGPDHWVTANGVESNHVTWSGEPNAPVPRLRRRRLLQPHPHLRRPLPSIWREDRQRRPATASRSR
ncbi:hypothetical protein [Plantactinospora sp. KBS50]|uniref:hypothetical protein n=1 Tax=Plantactinospora sp. KBS50 TaxID=2024580 RepID=UPI0018DFB0C7|nr:hypothetical protein [Plantactinospora sp. KBS50]